MPPLRSVLTEAAVLSVFLIGLLVSRKLKRRWHPAEIIALYAIGLLFELLTAHMWNYRHICLILPTPIDTDISALFPLGWAGLVMIATPAAESLWERFQVRRWWTRHLVLMAVWLVLGAVSETTFYNLGMIEYVESAGIALWLPRLPHSPPTFYILGYSLLPALVSQFMKWLERGLERDAR